MVKGFIFGSIIGILAFYGLNYALEGGGFLIVPFYILGTISEEKFNKGTFWLVFAIISIILYLNWIFISYFIGGGMGYLCGIIDDRRYFSLTNISIALGIAVGGGIAFFIA